MSKKSPIPGLMMGEKRAVHSTDPRLTADKIAEAITNLEYWEPQKHAGSFNSKAASYTINDLSLVAQSSTPMRAGAGYSSSFNIEFSYTGVCSGFVDGVRYDWIPRQQAVLFPEITGRDGPSDTRSIVMTQFDKQRLIETTRNMLGAESAANLKLDINDTREVSLNYGNVNFDGMFRALWRYIDTLDADDRLLEMIGIDDLFYRNVSILLHPQLFLNQAIDDGNSPNISNAMMDRVCDAMKDMSRKPYTMTELESLSGVSTRYLQYQFKKRFSCSPMDWQRQERLKAARAFLINRQGPATISELSHQLGFSSPSNFIAYYYRQFGETPAETRKKL